jgi:hypothetical protein
MHASLRLFVTALLIYAVSLPSVLAQANPPASGTGTRSGPVLEEGTPVKLRISRTVSSADAQVGETVDFEVLEAVKVGDLVVIPKGGTAWATVTAAEAKKRMARGGKLDMNIDSVRLVDGEKAALRAVKDMKGGGHTGAMTGGIVATAIVFWPAAPFFLFMHGKDITVPKGTEITAYVNGDFHLDLAKFQGGTTQVLSAAVNQPSQQTNQVLSATLDISSTPSNADIELDGTFVGDTPSTIGVPPGEHTIKVTKKGYAPWERKIHSSTGNVRLAAELDSSPTPVAIPSSSSSTNSTAQSVHSVPAAIPSNEPSPVKASAASSEPVAQIKPAVMSSTTAVPPPSAQVDADGTVSISSDPDGADIFVDSVGQGHAPAVVKLKPGKHHIQLVKNGYKDSASEIDVKAGSTLSVVGKLEK